MLQGSKPASGLHAGILATVMATAALAAVAILPPTAVQAAPMDTVEAQLAQMGIAESTVADIDLVAQKNASPGGGGQTRGYLAYVRLSGAEGYLVYKLSRGGAHLGTFTTGELRLPDVPHY